MLQDWDNGLKPNRYIVLVKSETCNLCAFAEDIIGQYKCFVPILKVKSVDFPIAVKAIPAILVIEDGKVLARLYGGLPHSWCVFISNWSMRFEGMSTLKRWWGMFLTFYTLLKVYREDGVPYLAPKKVRSFRRDICKTCDFRKGIACGDCGCFIRGKTSFSIASCGQGKW